ncbi:hypothetical protein D9757_006493 [Collybiopsis confluens]|uniref:Uncharacterized protein n=1 Tax=Collybiopsis confluens TaxID=2823264 RepID=A0A8H5HK94_9AGAR|nr:hypothetical protein D9757_006493 [Collybiopsis confluens]
MMATRRLSTITLIIGSIQLLLLLRIFSAVSAMPFSLATQPSIMNPPILEVRPAPPHIQRYLVNHQRRDTTGQNCAMLSAADVQKIPGWAKLEKIANEKWGNHKRKIVTNEQHTDTTQYPATICIASEAIKVRYTGQPTCQSNKISAIGGVSGTNGTLSLAITQGFTASSQFTISQSAAIGLSQTFSASLDFPQVSGATEGVTVSASITNTLTKSFTAQYNEITTVTLLMTSPNGKSCDAGTNVTHCTIQGEGEINLVAGGYVWFEYEDKQAEKGKKDKHYKCNLSLLGNLHLNDVLTVAERTSVATFEGSINSCNTPQCIIKFSNLFVVSQELGLDALTPWVSHVTNFHGFHLDDEMTWSLFLFSALSWLGSALADATNNTTASTGPQHDPYLDYKPEFARSLPVQTLVTGVVFTLVAVLFVHIVFTGQYHWPLAPVNYALQLSGVVTLLVSLIATINVILNSAVSESEHWPYMLTYMAVNVPPLDMLNVDQTANSSANNDIPPLNSWTSAERGTWLMMNAAVSALVQITHIQFLTLLYPSRLEGRLIYALLGPLALFAAIMQLIPIQPDKKLIMIANDIRNVCNATLSLLFTTSLFIWGLLVNRSQAWRTDGGTAVFGASALTLALVSTALSFLFVPKSEEYVWLPGLMWAVILWQSFLGWWWWVGAGSGQTTDDVVEHLLKKGAKRRERNRERKERAKRQRREAEDMIYSSGHSDDSNPPTNTSQTQNTQIETGSNDLSSSRHSRPRPRRTASSGSNGSVVSTSSSSSPSSHASLPQFLPRAVHEWYDNIRQAHVRAARRQTVERVERIREMESQRSERARGGRSRSRYERFNAWGLGLGPTRHGSEGETEYEMEDTRVISRRRTRRNSNERHNDVASEDEDHDELEGGVRSQRLPSPTRARVRNTRISEIAGGRPSSIWWWGPLNRWRLQDSTAYC